MTKTIVIQYDSSKPIVDSDGDDMTFIYKALNTLSALRYPTPRNIKVLKHGAHRDSFEKGFEKALIRATF